MAYKSNSQIIDEYRKKQKEKYAERSASNTTSQNRQYKNSELVEMRRFANMVNSRSFQSDLNNTNALLDETFGDWQDRETMQNNRISIEKMYNKLGQYQNYQKNTVVQT